VFFKNIFLAYRPENAQEYAMLIFDFSYLNNEELYEKRINDNPVCLFFFSFLKLFFGL